MHTDSSTIWLWALRIVWVLQPMAFVPMLADATNSLDGFGSVFVATVAWAAWAAVLLATLVPSSVSLTVGRLIAPVSLIVVAVVALGPSVAGWKTAVSAAAALLAVLVWFSGETGGALAQGSAYGAEQRFPLQAPVPYVVPMVVSWAVLAAASFAGVVLVANRTAIVGALVIAAAIAIGWYLGPRFHILSRRWLVVVPAGIVVHDPMLLVENSLFRSAQVAAVHLAPVGTEAADLTGGTAGVVVEIVLRETDTVIKVAGRDKPQGTAIHVLSVLVAPSRPGRALAAAAEGRLPVG